MKQKQFTDYMAKKYGLTKKEAVCCKVEHPFLIVKKQMGYSKVVYRGIAKNMHRFHMLFASANLLMCSRAGKTKDFVGCTV